MIPDIDIVLQAVGVLAVAAIGWAARGPALSAAKARSRNAGGRVEVPAQPPYHRLATRLPALPVILQTPDVPEWGGFGHQPEGPLKCATARKEEPGQCRACCAGKAVLRNAMLGSPNAALCETNWTVHETRMVCWPVAVLGLGSGDGEGCVGAVEAQHLAEAEAPPRTCNNSKCGGSSFRRGVAIVLGPPRRRPQRERWRPAQYLWRDPEGQLSQMAAARHRSGGGRLPGSGRDGGDQAVERKLGDRGCPLRDRRARPKPRKPSGCG